MLDFDALFEDLEAADMAPWAGALRPLLAERTADAAHGKLAEWRNALARLPAVARRPGRLNDARVGIEGGVLDDGAKAAAVESLMTLRPWRKGPFDLGGVVIDTEWRSDLKWDRVAGTISPLAGRTVLDVGSGNGYYGLRMRGAGARLVVGIDPTLLYVLQFRAIAHFMQPEPVHVLPLRLDDLPAALRAFDTVFSMGVLYHQRSPIDHLRQLRDALRPGGELVLETLILPGSEPCARTPEARYARMRNVWLLPTVPELRIWLERSGFTGITVADVTRTTPDEQRSTDWMPFESLADALDPANPHLTVEGWPAPCRAVIVCSSPA